MAIWDPRQITRQNVDSQRGSHEDSAYPEAPVTMHASPVRAWIGLTRVATIAFLIMLASGHLASIAAEYSPWRAA
jgi:hypothetical protein